MEGGSKPQTHRTTPRVAYVWSQHLQNASDDLPANVGRSGMVHSLIRSLGLLDNGESRKSECGAEDEGKRGPDSRSLASSHLDTEEPDGRASGNDDKNDEVESARSGAEQDKVGGQIVADPNGQRSNSRSESRASRAERTTGKARARLVAPDLRLGTKAFLLKYHEPAYVEYLLKDRSSEFDEDGEHLPPSGPSSSSPSPPDDHSSSEYESDSNASSSSSSSSSSHRPRKRRRRRGTPPPSKRSHGLTHDNPPFPSLAAYTQLVASATSTACRLLIDKSERSEQGENTESGEEMEGRDRVDCAIVWDGGRHHAKRAEASGFCYVADIVLGCMLLSKEGRVAVPIQDRAGQRMRTRTNGDSQQQPSERDISNAHDLRASTAHDQNQDQDQPDHPKTDREERAIPRPHRLKTRPPRILYLDFDLHQGDGVALAFHSPTHYPFPLPSNPSRVPRPPAVLTLSIHHSSPVFFPPPLSSNLSILPFPETPHPFTLSLPLDAYPSAKTYSTLFTGAVEPVAKAWNPDYVVLQLGADGLPGDRVGQYGNWSTHGEGSMTWVVEQVKKWGKKLCVLGGGGYNHPNTARAWAAVTSVLLDRPLEPDTPIPHHDHFEAYTPSFALDVPAGHMKDENTSEDIQKAIDAYQVIAGRIAEIVQCHS